MLTYFLAYLCKTSKSHLADSRAMTPSSVCVFISPSKQTLHQLRTLPLVRPAILSWVESFLYASVKSCWARLVTTHREAWLREARSCKRCSRSFFRQFSACHRINFDLDICRGFHGLRDNGFLPRLLVFGIVARVALWGGSYYVWMRLQRFLENRWLGHQPAGEWCGQNILRRT